MNGDNIEKKSAIEATLTTCTSTEINLLEMMRCNRIRSHSPAACLFISLLYQRCHHRHVHKLLFIPAGDSTA